MNDGWPRKSLDDVVARIYAATTEPELWNSVMETIGRRLRITLPEGIPGPSNG